MGILLIGNATILSLELSHPDPGTSSSVPVLITVASEGGGNSELREGVEGVLLLAASQLQSNFTVSFTPPQRFGSLITLCIILLDA